MKIISLARILALSCLGVSAVVHAHAAVPYKTVKVQGRQLMVDFDQNGVYTPFLIKGVGYEPMPIGRNPSDWGWPPGDSREDNIYNDARILDRDFSLLKTMNANAVRIWRANDVLNNGQFPNKLTLRTLDYARKYGLKVIPGFMMDNAGQWVCEGSTKNYQQWVNYADPDLRNYFVAKFRAFVKQFKNQPDILFWAIGNENNLSLNTGDVLQVRAYYSLVNLMAAQVRAVECAAYHPVAIVDGGIDFVGRADYRTRDKDLPYIDIWGSNVYTGNSFGNVFSRYKAMSGKPLWIAEYGADAFHSPDFLHPAAGYEDQLTQAEWDGALYKEIYANRSVTIGGTVMEYTDEWWKPEGWACENPKDGCASTASTAVAEYSPIGSSAVTFFWDKRDKATGYSLYVGTSQYASDIYFGSNLGLVTQANVKDIPLDGGLIYVRLSYNIPGSMIEEFMQFKTNRGELPGAPVRFKIKPYGSVHNAFGFGPADSSCPPDGTYDYYPAAKDKFYHEEWWGIASIARNGYNPEIVTPRMAYYTLQSLFAQSLPLRSSGSPSGILPVGTVSVNLSVKTDGNAVCKYDIVPNTAYAVMPYTFSVNGGTTHSSVLSGLRNGSTYTYYVKCTDSAGHVNNDNYPVRFSVAP